MASFGKINSWHFSWDVAYQSSRRRCQCINSTTSICWTLHKWNVFRRGPTKYSNYLVCIWCYKWDSLQVTVCLPYKNGAQRFNLDKLHLHVNTCLREMITILSMAWICWHVPESQFQLKTCSKNFQQAIAEATEGTDFSPVYESTTWADLDKQSLKTTVQSSCICMRQLRVCEAIRMALERQMYKPGENCTHRPHSSPNVHEAIIVYEANLGKWGNQSCICKICQDHVEYVFDSRHLKVCE